MPNRLSAAALALLLCGAGAAAAEPTAAPWTLSREHDGIRIYTREVADSPLRAVRGVVRIEAPLARVVALLRDVPARPTWDATCAAAAVVRRLSADEQIVYLHSHLPWPVSDRDMVLHAIWTREPQSGVVRLHAQAVPGEVAVRDDRVRVRSARNDWILRRLDDAQTELVTEVQLDPGGKLPLWLIDQLVDQAPFDALRRMRALLEVEHAAAAGDAVVRPQAAAQ